MIILEYLSRAISIIGVAIITLGAAKGLFLFLKLEIGRSRKKGYLNAIKETRIVVGQHILLGLEFLIGADVINTVIDPGMEEIAILAAIVLIRTAISYFLTREMTTV
ncbi:MAG: DUF1622 domain-containing protein [Bacilli bacterium]|nr:DUF1622 domain-containing protein [Bacilli bacterium]